MADNDKVSEKEWERVQVYMPPDFYEVIQARAKRRGVSLSSEAYRLIRIGLANMKPNENIEADLLALERYVKLHLEPLAFIAAMDSAFGAESWRYQFRASYKDRSDDLLYQLGQRATKRLQRKLRDLDREDDAAEEE